MEVYHASTVVVESPDCLILNKVDSNSQPYLK